MAASRLRSSLGSGRLRDSVSQLKSGGRQDCYLLRDEDAGSGRVQILGVNTINLVAASHVRRAGSESMLSVSQGDIQTLHVTGRDGTLRASLPQRLDGRRDEHIVTIICADTASWRPGRC